jgi:hypothetical protein
MKNTRGKRSEILHFPYKNREMLERRKREKTPDSRKLTERDATELSTTNTKPWLSKFVDIQPMRTRLGVDYANCGNNKTALYTKIP